MDSLDGMARHYTLYILQILVPEMSQRPGWVAKSSVLDTGECMAHYASSLLHDEVQYAYGTGFGWTA